MLPLDDPLWTQLMGGYKMPYNAAAPLRRLYADGPSEELWDELWDELHHQGDVGQASYAAVPHLLELVRRSRVMDWNPIGLIAVIEIERPTRNPKVRADLADAYFRAIDQVPEVVASHPQREWDAVLTQNIMAGIALARGQRLLARAYLELSLEAATEWLRDVQGYDERDLRR